MYSEDDDGATEHIAAKRFKQGEQEHFEEAESHQAKKELAFPLLENPFAQDADFEELDLAAEFWTKPRKQNTASLAAAAQVEKDKDAADGEDSSSYGDENGSSSESDDVEQLMREYEKLKQEREEEKRLKELAKMEEIKRR